MEPRTLVLCRCFSFSKVVFSGSMVVFGGVQKRTFISFQQSPTMSSKKAMAWSMFHPFLTFALHHSKYPSIMPSITPLSVVFGADLLLVNVRSFVRPAVLLWRKNGEPLAAKMELRFWEQPDDGPSKLGPEGWRKYGPKLDHPNIPENEKDSSAPRCTARSGQLKKILNVN